MPRLVYSPHEMLALLKATYPQAKLDTSIYGDPEIIITPNVSVIQKDNGYFYVLRYSDSDCWLSRTFNDILPDIAKALE